ncbi:hypothetical protein [Neptunicoccus cionae]|uniref:Uncharacterized protein n=1 Tax=Neptunicoccus cionae TaxID=2035344 RepID=A0A916VLF6_9RHOB|nr:hypothetical protein [Amylibacter cionae]GGA04845.1 hypothetical protein GCM10011498_00180 [Amylibacter cionae]
MIAGGGGADRFIFRGAEADAQIVDFEDGKDLIHIVDAADQFSDLQIDRGVGYLDVTLAGTAGTELRLRLIDPASELTLTAEDFDFG